MAAHNTLGKEARDAGAQMGKWVASRTAPFLPPWLLVGAAGVAAALGHAHFDENTAATAVMGATSTAVTAATWQEASKRSKRLRGHATATVAATCGYITAGTVAGPLEGGVGTLYAIGGAALALSWNVRYALRNSVESEAGDGDGLLGQIGMAKSHVITSKVDGSRVEATLQLPAGEMTPDDAQKKAALIAGAAHVPATAVRIAPNPDDHSQVTLSLVAQDVLKSSSPWPGPSAPGGSIGKAIVLGVAEDGLPLEFYLPGDPDPSAPRNLAHTIWSGMNGSGKSEGFTVLALEVLTRSDVLLWLADAAKGAQTLGEIEDGADWIASGPDEVQALLEALPHVIRARADKLGRLGYKQWTPQAYAKDRIPMIVLHLEEAADGSISDSPDVKTIAQQARSAGILLSLSLQRASHTNLSTDVRAELGQVIMFGCQKPGDSFVLDDEVVAAGAAPWAWKNTKPGYCYVQSPSIDRDRWAMPNRTFYLNPAPEYRAGLKELVARYRGVRAVADDTTARAAGEAYAAYRAKAKSRHAAARSAGVPAPRADLMQRDHAPDQVLEAEIVETHGPSEAAQTLADRLATASAEELPALLEYAAKLSDEDLADALAADAADHDLSGVDVDQELPELPSEAAAGMVLGAQVPPVEEMSREDALAAVAALIDDMEAEGHTKVGPKDIASRWKDRSRSWVSRSLAHLADTGRLRETRRVGVYQIVPRNGYAQ